MRMLTWFRLALLALAAVLMAIDYYQFEVRERASNLTGPFLAVVGAASLSLLGFLVLNHAAFPLHLEVMEGTVFQHLQRARALQAIYPEPSPGFVALAYNPLYYYAAIPLAIVLGPSLLTLRVFSILGLFGCVVTLFLVVREHTRSSWWGLVAAGLFAASYRVMDAYLDTAHSDSWFLFTSVFGTYLLAKKGPWARQILGILALVSSFWFKQHGAIFVIGAIFFLTWRDGPKAAMKYWIIGVLLGPILFFILAPMFLGHSFLYFTWEIPSQWSELSLDSIRRIAAFVFKGYPILGIAAAASVARSIRSKTNSPTIYHVQGVAAALTAVLGSLDPGSSDNVFIPMGFWIILLGTLGLHELGERLKGAPHFRWQHLGLAVSFVLLAYDPQPLITPRSARAAYADLISMIDDLEAQVYAPSQGFLGEEVNLFPTAHWVALEDMIRGPGRDTTNHPNTRALLSPAVEPSGDAYILTNYPLDTYPWMAFLEEDYVLVQDFEDEYISLRSLPHRWDSGWPRYLYRFETGHSPG